MVILRVGLPVVLLLSMMVSAVYANEIYLPLVQKSVDPVLATMKIAFEGHVDWKTDIYVIDANGSNLTNLTHVASKEDDPAWSPQDPAWSPDDSKIAFVSSDASWSSDIYVMNADGSNHINLTNDGQSTDRAPVWSPDGSKIAYNCHGPGYIDICSIGADGTNQTNVTRHRRKDENAAWSPDGSKIVFTSTRDMSAELYVMNADGSDQTRLTYLYDGWGHHYPVWSPDSRRIAFTIDNSEIYVLNVDGGDLTWLTTFPRYCNEPAWSPGGSKIAFTGNPGDPHNADIYVIDADGGNLVRLTEHPETDSGPLWSPDGGKIAFGSGRNGLGEIYIMNVDGSDLTRITDNSMGEWNRVWSPLVYSN